MTRGEFEARLRQMPLVCPREAPLVGTDGITHAEDHAADKCDEEVADFSGLAALLWPVVDAATWVLHSEKDSDGEGEWYCVLGSDMLALRQALARLRPPADPEKGQ